MKWIDEVVYVCVVVWLSCYCVMVSVGNICFQCLILVGNLVELKVCVVVMGCISMYIYVLVYVGDLKGGVLCQMIDCFVVFVVVDENGNLVLVLLFVFEIDEQCVFVKYVVDVWVVFDKIVEMKLEEVVKGIV